MLDLATDTPLLEMKRQAFGLSANTVSGTAVEHA
jgi:hypothetical protein